MTGVLEEVVEQRVFLAFWMYRVYGIAKSMDEGDAILDCRCRWCVAGIFYSLHCRDLSLSTIQSCYLLHLHTWKAYTWQSKLSSKLYSRSSKNSVTTADTRASFFSRDSR